MSDDKYDRMLDRVRRLLAIAEDPAASENEAATAWEQAQKLMTLYAIEDWQLHNQERRNDPIIKHRVGLSPNPMNRTKAELAHYVAHGNRCRTYSDVSLSGNNRQVVDAVVFYGTERDCRQAEMVWTSMETYRASHWRQAARDCRGKANAKWRNGYYKGFQERIWDRYEEIRRTREAQEQRDAETGGEGRELALVGRELVLVRESQLEEFDAQLTAQLGLVKSEPAKLDMSEAAIREGGKAADKVALGLDELDNRRQIQAEGRGTKWGTS